MKILVIGDTHGRKGWKDIVSGETPNLTIFLGDFVSTHDRVTEEWQINNCDEIFKYKEENPDKVILLRGNHCVQHAIPEYWTRCSGYFPKVGEWMQQNRTRWENLTQWVYIHENLLFSHAGVSTIWMQNNNIESVDDINTLEPSEIFGFTPEGWWDNHGDSKTQPPTWIRPESLLRCMVPEYTQIVGHTPVGLICNISEEVRGKSVNPNTPDLWLCDCLPKQYLVIEDGEFIVKNIELPDEG